MLCFYFAVVAVASGYGDAAPAVIPANSVLVPIENFLPNPYKFGYEFADGLGMFQHRRETSDGAGTVEGSYGYVDHNGVSRKVDYVADKNGFRPVIHSNEPGLSGQSSANALFIVQPPPPAAVAQGLRATVNNLSI